MCPDAPTAPDRAPPADAAADVDRIGAEIDDERLAASMLAAVRELYPIFRGITGEGVRETLRLLQRVAPIELHEVASGEQVLDWTVPREWTYRAARLTGPDGEVIADADVLNLHLVANSAPFRGKVSREELEAHLHSLPEQPDLVPYRTSYYAENWGFCLSHAVRSSLKDGTYDVLVDTRLEDGSLTYGEVVVPGRQTDEVLVSAHCCHPSLANDNLSGVVMAATLASLMGRVRPRYTYRFLFAPGTIGAITWLAKNREHAAHIRHGLVANGVGSGGPLHYKRSRRGDAEIDQAATHVLEHCGEPFETRDFSPWGYDERQYCSPGFDLPVGSLTRTPHGEYPEYHTSADTPALLQAAGLVGSLRRYLEIFAVLEGNRTYLNLSPMGEPQLGKRGLYGAVGGLSHAAPDQLAMLWVLNFSDGSHSLLDIAARSKVPFRKLREAATALQASGLLEVAS